MLTCQKLNCDGKTICCTHQDKMPAARVWKPEKREVGPDVITSLRLLTPSSDVSPNCARWLNMYPKCSAISIFGSIHRLSYWIDEDNIAYRWTNFWTVKKYQKYVSAVELYSSVTNNRQHKWMSTPNQYNENREPDLSDHLLESLKKSFRVGKPNEYLVFYWLIRIWIWMWNADYFDWTWLISLQFINKL